MSDDDEIKKFSILFVCLGNICRSPMAEAVFKHLIKINDYGDRFETIESAGTAGYHIDEPPDQRTMKVCMKYDVDIDSLAQQLQPQDFYSYDYILAMDRTILRDIKQIQPPGCKALVKLFGDFGDGKDVEDPYYGLEDGFEENFKQCGNYALGLLRGLGLCPMKILPGSTF